MSTRTIGNLKLPSSDVIYKLAMARSKQIIAKAKEEEIKENWVMKKIKPNVEEKNESK